MKVNEGSPTPVSAFPVSDQLGDIAMKVKSWETASARSRRSSANDYQFRV